MVRIKEIIKDIYSTGPFEYPRYYFAYVEYDDGISNTYYFKDKINDFCRKDASVKYSSIGIYFSKTKKQTFLCDIPTETDPVLDITEALGRFDYIFVVDTNKNKIKKENLRIKNGDDEKKEYLFLQTSLLALKVIHNNDPEFLSINFDTKCVGLLENDTKSFEQVGWKWAIEIIQSLDISGKIGLVVDSDYSNLHLYNKHEKNIINCELPPNFRLIYATSNYSGTVLNQIMKLCDNDFKSEMEKVKFEITFDDQ